MELLRKKFKQNLAGIDGQRFLHGHIKNDSFKRNSFEREQGVKIGRPGRLRQAGPIRIKSGELFV